MTDNIVYHCQEPRAKSQEPRANLLPSESRIEYIDIFRAFGILLMVMGHIGFGGKFDHFIHAFHMPMFFFVSGMFFEPSYNRFKSSSTNPLYSFIRRKTNTLLIPYIYFGTFHYLVWVTRNWSKAYYLSPLFSLMSVNTFGLPYAGALWFLTSLFLTEIIYCAVFHFVHRSYARNIVIILMVIAGHCEYYFLPFKLPFGGGAALVGLGLYHLGFLLRDKVEALNLNLLKTLLLGTVTTGLIFLNGYVNMRIGIYGFVPLFYINALASFTVGISIAKFFQNTQVAGYLERIGRDSIVYVCLNQIIILVMFRLLYGNMGKLAIHFCVLVLTVTLLYIIGCIISESAFNFLIGRSHSQRLRNFSLYFLLAVLFSLIIGINYVKSNYAIQPQAVHLPDTDRISTPPPNSENLREVIALNVKYLLNTQWTLPHKYAFSQSSSTKYPFEPSPRQRRELLKSAESFKNWRRNEYLNVVNTTGETVGENALRVWGHTCFVMASALKAGIYDENLTRIPRDDALKMTAKLTASLARNHCANTYMGWGNLWQSALWAENIAFAGWLIWDCLNFQEREFIVNMVVNEADRFIDYSVPYYKNKEGRIIYPNDTKAEENAWNSRILALAVCMLPEHSHNKLWEAKLNELLLSACAVPEDTSSEKIIGGVKLKDILKGSNLNPDGTLINHGLYHIDYMTVTIEGMTDTAIIYALSGRKIPASSLFNHDIIYSSLVDLDLGKYDPSKAGQYFYGRSGNGKPSNTLNMPGVNDWGGKWFANCYLADTEAEIFGLDSNCPEGLKAYDWSSIHIEEIMRMVHRNSTGQIFTDGENYFVSGETYAMHNLCKSYILRALHNSGSLSLSE